MGNCLGQMGERDLAKSVWWFFFLSVSIFIPIILGAASPSVAPRPGVNPDFYVPPTIPPNGSALWQVNGKVKR